MALKKVMKLFGKTEDPDLADLLRQADPEMDEDGESRETTELLVDEVQPLLPDPEPEASLEPVAVGVVPQSPEGVPQGITDYDPEAELGTALFRLRVFSDQEEIRLVSLGEVPLVVGRDPGTAQIVVSAAVISKVHCSLVIRESKIWVRDLDSTNGTFIEGVQVLEETEVLPGQVVSLGRRGTVRILVEQGPAPQ